MVEWRNGGEGYFPAGETTRLLGELRPRYGYGAFQSTFQKANADAMRSSIGQFLLPKLEALDVAHGKLLHEAGDAFKQSSSTLHSVEAHCHAVNALVNLVQQSRQLAWSKCRWRTFGGTTDRDRIGAGAGAKAVSKSTESTVAAADAESEPAAARPQWNRGKKELRLGGKLIKRFRQIAKNQFLVLDAFQELGWPSAIDDPMPGGQVDAIQRVQDTAKSLNDGMVTDSAVRFSTNGNGTGFIWSAIA